MAAFRRAILTLSLLVLALGGMAEAGQSQREWRAYQMWLNKELKATREHQRQADAVKRLSEFDGGPAVGTAVTLLSNRQAHVALAAEEALGWMRSDEAITTLIRIFPSPQAAPVRLRILRACSQIHDPRIEKLLLKCLDTFGNGPPLVATIEALGEHGSKAATPKLIKLLSNRMPFPVKLVAIRALARIPTDTQIDPLIECMATSKGRGIQEAHIALKMLTGEEMKLDPDLWRKWRKGAPKFQPEQLQISLRTNLVNSDLGEKADAMYYGVPIHAKRIIFVLDKSGSMSIGKPYRRLTMVKEELVRLLKTLDDDVYFNVIFFSSRLVQWKPRGLIQATKMNTERAIKFVQSATPSGATCTHDAMAKALALAEKNYAETIFLLTDGAPFQGGKYLDFDEVSNGIRMQNDWLKVRINTIGVFYGADEAAAKNALEPTKADLMRFLQRIADENDGRFVEK